MRGVCWIVGLALCLSGCTTEADQRVRDYNEDAFHQFHVGHYQAAAEDFEASLALRPDDTGLLFNAGQCRDRIGDNARAESWYNECLRRSPEHVLCRHALATLYIREGRGQDAIRLVQDWLAREPTQAAPYVEDGWLWHQLHDLPAAQGRLQQALAIDPQDPRALVELGTVYEDMHYPQRAIILYERSLQVDPNQPTVAARLGQLRTQVGPPPS